MATNKKISELEETNDVNNCWVAGVSENQNELVSRKYNLGHFGDTVDQTVNSIIGQVSEFNTEETYYPGQYVMYNNILYKFNSMHSPGNWIGQPEVSPTNVYQELSTLGDANYEEVNIKLYSEDNQATLSNLTIGILETDTQGNTLNTRNVTTDSNGEVQVNIQRGRLYKLSFDNIAGYYPLGDVTYKAELKQRNIDVTYHKTLSGNCSLTIKFNTFNGGNSSFPVGSDCTILNDNQEVFKTATIQSDYTATFTELHRGESYTVGLPTDSSYVTPETQTTIIRGDSSSLIFNYKYIKSNAYGIFLVDKNFEEYAIADQYDIDLSWTSGTLPSGYSKVTSVIGVATSGANIQKKDYAVKFKDSSELKNLSSSDIVAIHVYPEDLAITGYDYFVKVSDLCTSPGSKAWSTVGGLNYPDVSLSTSYYNGKKMTYYMAYDARVLLGTVSPAAEFANQQTFLYNGENLVGYIGTRAQMAYLYNTSSASNLQDIYCVLGLLGFTPNYYDRTTWSSSQYSQANAWGWIGASHFWGSYGKTGANGVLPVFSH